MKNSTAAALGAALLLPVIATAASARPDDGADDIVRHESEAFRAGGYPFSEAVEAGGFLFLSGMIGTQPGTAGGLEEGIEAQSKRVMDNIQAALAKHGLGMDRIVKCTVMIDDMDDWAAFNEVYRTYFDGSYPARSAFGADGLALGALVEVECIALAGSNSG
ncbi:hypothetical protein B5C34_01330 [Pacificimonas flava]|uniref:Uncharacterized protein n=2 Tax=Pacificimonas TaxID=1960290 RepID=A0A219B273_9SPHN|nr:MULTISPECIES: RidA family protein [Pacificimonas]MBZ6378142.1 RidA family protein [Pacificimonas aurantium]OWV32223.1 hypothetical protein B5C34_01330 [Pacificimonas flava]